MRVCTAAVSPAALYANTRAPFCIWSALCCTARGCATPSCWVVILLHPSWRQWKSWKRLEQAVSHMPCSVSGTVCYASVVCALCVPAGIHRDRRLARGPPLALSLPSLLIKLLQGISLHKGLIWARARDARLRALPCCLVSYNTKPRH